MPFGTFLFCSDSDSTCFENPDSSLLILITLSKLHVENQGLFQLDEYGNLVEKLRRKAMFKDSSMPAGDKTRSDSLAVGISLQLQALGLTPHMVKQEHNIHINELETKIKTLEQIFIQEKKKRVKELFIYSKRISFDPSKKLNEMKGLMTYLEGYKKETKTYNIGYYDS
ncbi:senescence-associated carboxylesterase [Trifolium repens]|nr:senescence-associated carboxylesterase [Trifolium repens]